MEESILNLKKVFNDIITTRNSVKNIFDILLIKINKLKVFYIEFIKNKKDELFVFGLDTFHFQSKLIDIEYDGVKRLFLVINNRMYCEYFKLNKIMTEYILKNINEQKYIKMIKPDNFPIYKDLEPFKEYNFNIVLEIHDNILNLFNVLVLLLNNKENDLTIHKSKQNIGLNIDNFVTTFNYHNNIVRENITMFITYIDFFHKTHTKYLNRLNNKIQNILININNDINFDEFEENNNSLKNEVNDDMSINLDKETNKKYDEKENIAIIIDDTISTKSRSNSITSEISISTTASNINNNNVSESNNVNEINVSEINVSEDENESTEYVKPVENNIVANVDTEQEKKKRTYKPRKKKI
jgi:hypothetical protein